jgi:hypothetical protein
MYYLIYSSEHTCIFWYIQVSTHVFFGIFKWVHMYYFVYSSEHTCIFLYIQVHMSWYILSSIICSETRLFVLLVDLLTITVLTFFSQFKLHSSSMSYFFHLDINFRVKDTKLKAHLLKLLGQKIWITETKHVLNGCIHIEVTPLLF